MSAGKKSDEHRHDKVLSNLSELIQLTLLNDWRMSMSGIRQWSLFVLCLCFLAPFTAYGKTLSTVRIHKSVTCSDCHTCKKPTTENPCLRQCPRDIVMENMRSFHPKGDGPDVVFLNELENLYEPVQFLHKLHASMANMNKGCVICHHNTPADAAHPACKSCHRPENSGGEVDVRQPGLKRAYHKQCMGCHQDWSHETGCVNCHLPKRNKEAWSATPPASPYRPCKEPDRKVYKTNSSKGQFVSFFHKNHAHLYGMKCSDCHKNDPCAGCHYQQEKPVSVVEASADAMHYKCAACHNISDQKRCTKCHSKKERKKFDHRLGSGWALNRFHQSLSCSDCHPANSRLAKLDKSCNHCHAGWNSENFSHVKTGLELDETHVEAECSDCHIDNRYEEKPTCDNCHDEKPEGLPGRRRS